MGVAGRPSAVRAPCAELPRETLKTRQGGLQFEKVDRDAEVGLARRPSGTRKLEADQLDV